MDQNFGFQMEVLQKSLQYLLKLKLMTQQIQEKRKIKSVFLY